MKTTLRFLIIALSLSLGACVSTGSNAGSSFAMNNANIGTVLGAALGGYAGSTMGGRGTNGQLIGTALGTIGGALLGRQFGDTMDQVDAMANNPNYATPPAAYPANTGYGYPTNGGYYAQPTSPTRNYPPAYQRPSRTDYSMPACTHNCTITSGR